MKSLIAKEKGGRMQREVFLRRAKYRRDSGSLHQINKEERTDNGRRYMNPNDPLFEFEDGDDLDDL